MGQAVRGYDRLSYRRGRVGSVSDLLCRIRLTGDVLVSGSGLDALTRGLRFAFHSHQTCMRETIKSKRDETSTDADQKIRDYYEHETPSETEAFPNPSERVRTSESLAGRADRLDDDQVKLSGGDPDVSFQGIDAGTETPGGSNPTPDQDLVDEIGEAAGITYEDNEPLKFGEKAAVRDEVRWELNPASSEDYQERQTMQTEPNPQTPSRSKPATAANSRTSSRRKRPG